VVNMVIFMIFTDLPNARNRRKPNLGFFSV
jgi:hypothetical protein